MRWVELTPWQEHLTAVQVEAMDWTMVTLTDQMLVDFDLHVDYWDQTILYDYLPPAFRDRLRTRRAALLIAYLAATTRIAEPNWTMPVPFASPAEEIMAWMFVQEMKGTVSFWLDTPSEENDEEPKWPTDVSEADLDFEALIGAMFEDTDFAMYFDPRLDGFDDDPTITEFLRLGDSMTFERFFLPYNKERNVHPYLHAQHQEDQAEGEAGGDS